MIYRDFTIEFDGFAIDIVVDVELSALTTIRSEYSRRADPQWVFMEADTFLNVQGKRYPLLERREMENFGIEIDIICALISNRVIMNNLKLEDHINKGGLFDWIKCVEGKIKTLDGEITIGVSDDIYNLYSEIGRNHTFLKSNTGCIALYGYNGSAVIEANIYKHGPYSGQSKLQVCSDFIEEDLLGKLRQVKREAEWEVQRLLQRRGS